MRSRFFRTFILLAFLAVPSSGADQCDPISTFADGKKPTREIFVSAGASHSSPDGSRSAPYSDIRLALASAKPGDAIRLLPGEYRGGVTITGLRGTPENPIWIGGVSGSERPTIRGGSGGIHLSKVRYLIMENLEIAGATGNGINCDDGGDYANPEAAGFLLFKNIFIHDIGTGRNNDGLKLSGVNDFFVLNCDFSRISAGGSAIDHVGCHRGIVANSTFTECGNGVQCKGGSDDIEIRGNRFVRAGGRAINVGGSTGYAFFRPPLSKEAVNFEARNIRVFANVFEGSDAPICFVGAIRSIAANNTIINPTRWVFRILQETNSKDGYEFALCGGNEISNNLVWYERQRISAHVNVGGKVDAASFEFSNNLWFAHDAPARSTPTLPVREEVGISGTDPSFKDAAADNYALKPGTPAAGKGKLIPGLKSDFSGRCYAQTPSIGAFEVAE